MLGLGVVLCALGLPASHQSHHKSHTPDSDAAAPPGHALPASAKTHAVSKHKAVKHTAKSHAKSHHAHAAKSLEHLGLVLVLLIAVAEPPSSSLTE